MRSWRKRKRREESRGVTPRRRRATGIAIRPRHHVIQSKCKRRNNRASQKFSIPSEPILKSRSTAMNTENLSQNTQHENETSLEMTSPTDLSSNAPARLALPVVNMLPASDGERARAILEDRV